MAPMSNTSSTLLLTLLLAVGLVFFLRAASKDRTTVVEVQSPKPALEVLEGLSQWLTARGWVAQGGDPSKQLLRFRGQEGMSTQQLVDFSKMFGELDRAPTPANRSRPPSRRPLRPS